MTYADTGNFNVSITAQLTGEGVVYQTGQQYLSGRKTFLTDLLVYQGLSIGTGDSADSEFGPSDNPWLKINGPEDSTCTFSLEHEGVVGLSIVDDLWGAVGSPEVLFTHDALPLRFASSAGLKVDFDHTPTANGTNFLVSGDREPMKIVSTDADFVFSTGDFYIMRGGFSARSGVLPFATHGKSYYVRSNRLYDLVLAATGSEQVDYGATKILTSGQGAHLIGVVENFPGQGYTGWQTV